MVLLRQAAARVVEESEVPTPVAASAPVPKNLTFVSLTTISSPNHNVVTIKVNVDGEAQTFEHNGGVGPVDAMCGALRSLIPDFRVRQCRTEELGPGSEASAKAQVQIESRNFTFDGTAENPDTLVATAMAIISALERLRRFKDNELFGTQVPVIEAGFWAGFLVDENSGLRGRGEREIGLFRVLFNLDGKLIATFAKSPTGAEKKRLAKGYHHERRFALHKTSTAAGSGCHLFLQKPQASSD